MDTGNTINWHEVSFSTGLDSNRMMKYMTSGLFPQPVNRPQISIPGRRGNRYWLDSLLWSKRAVVRWGKKNITPFKVRK